MSTYWKPGKSLSSTLIDKSKLNPAPQSIQRYPKLQTESKASALAVKLARESFFGVKVMKQCTVMGHGPYPALPNAELNKLKQTLFSLFPKFWSNPIDFETLWKDCAEAVGQACKRLKFIS